MKASVKAVSPDEFILAALSPEQRVDAAFRLAREAFRHTQLTLDDVEDAVRRVRRKRYGSASQKRTSRR